MAQGLVSRDELLENAYQIAERNGVSALSVRGLANATGVSVGTVYRHFSAKDELTTATIQLYFKHAFYERFCHIDPQVGFVDYCREMHASMREVTTHFRECWLRGIDALPAVEKAAARLRESQQIEHILHGLVQIYEHDARISADLPDGFDAESVCRFVIATWKCKATILIAGKLYSICFVKDRMGSFSLSKSRKRDKKLR